MESKKAELQMASRARNLFLLLTNMLCISAFTFGGGFVIVSMMKKKFVDEKGWLSEEEMLDYAAIAQSCPGAIAVNAAILMGWRVAGAAGMAAAVLGTIIPPMAILWVVSMFYTAFAQNPIVATVLMGMQAGVAAVIVDVVLSLGSGIVKKRDPWQIALMAAAFIAAFVLKVNVILILLGSAVLGILLQGMKRRKKA